MASSIPYSFLWPNIVCLFYLSTHQLMNVNCEHFLALRNNATMNIPVWIIYVDIYFHFPRVHASEWCYWWYYSYGFWWLLAVLGFHHSSLCLHSAFSPMYLSVWISEFKIILYILRLECPVYSYTMWRSTREEKWDPSLVEPKPLVLGCCVWGCVLGQAGSTCSWQRWTWGRNAGRAA